MEVDPMTEGNEVELLYGMLSALGEESAAMQRKLAENRERREDLVAKLKDAGQDYAVQGKRVGLTKGRIGQLGAAGYARRRAQEAA